MKKLLSLVILIPVSLLLSCSQLNEEFSGQLGSITIRPAGLADLCADTRAASPDDFTLILYSGQTVVRSGIFSEFEQGKIEGLEPGTYRIVLTSHPDTFTPSFEEPVYRGIAEEVMVRSGANTPVEIICKQANAGVFFVYSPSLVEVGLSGVIPAITQEQSVLVYEGENREKRGYFNPGEALVKFTLGGNPVTVGGLLEKELNLRSEQLIQITLGAGTLEDGTLNITASIEVLDGPTDEVDFVLDLPEERSIMKVEFVSVDHYEVRFRIFCDNVQQLYVGVLMPSEVNWYMNELGMTLEEMCIQFGELIPADERSMANSETGLLVAYEGHQPETDYVFVACAVKAGERIGFIYEYSTTEDTTLIYIVEPYEGASVDAGVYELMIYDNEESEVWGEDYVNKVTVHHTNKEDIFVIERLFGIEVLRLIGTYNHYTGQIYCNGRNLDGSRGLNYESLIAVSDDYGYIYPAGVYVYDQQENPVDHLLINVVDGKLHSIPYLMYLLQLDEDTYEMIDWLEVSPADNVFTYKGLQAHRNKNFEKILRLRVLRQAA